MGYIHVGNHVLAFELFIAIVGRQTGQRTKTRFGGGIIKTQDETEYLVKPENGTLEKYDNS